MGTIFLFFLLAAGVYTGTKLGWFCFFHPIRCIRALFARNTDPKCSYSPTAALTVALAGTLGVGNITGVAAAIALGGSGALFWMWISAGLTMLIKYTEVYFAVETRESIPLPDGSTEYRGGPMRYMQAFRRGNTVSVLFCVLCIAASFVQGDLLQMAAAVSCTQMIFSSPLVPTALVLAFCAAFFVFGGRERIAAFTSRMIPPMCGIYLVLCAWILWQSAAQLPAVFTDIWKNAFSFRAAGGGICGAGITAAIRHGCAKGVFSHEAGCGTSPISHAGADTDSAVRQGLLGIAEVFVDTFVLCTLTGLVLLVSGFGYGGGCGGDYTAAVVDTFTLWFGKTGEYLIGISIVFYAFSTLVCWSFYGTECVRTLFAEHGAGYVRRMQRRYRLLYLLCTACGAFVPGTLLWDLSDALTMAMTVLNTSVLLLLLSRNTVKIPGSDRHTS